MLILIAFFPAKYAINHSVSESKIQKALNQTEQVTQHSLQSNNGIFLKLDSAVKVCKTDLAAENKTTDKNAAFKFRLSLQKVITGIKKITEDDKIKLAGNDKHLLVSASEDLTHVTDFAPIWVIATISISLGLGTMIGWKRIVVTIGEKIGNEHLNYAQGATAEIVAASTIGLSTSFGLPVSTTHVLSSGIAGAMVASGGKNNLNNKTLKNIAIAWVLTLPVAIVLALILFMFFHLFI
jgi:PiT family inorganic phosphate transporter